MFQSYTMKGLTNHVWLEQILKHQLKEIKGKMETITYNFIFHLLYGPLQIRYVLTESLHGTFQMKIDIKNL